MQESLRYPDDANVPSDAVAFMSALLCNADDRLGFDGIRAHPFMARIDWGLVTDDSRPVDYKLTLTARTTPAAPPPREVVKPSLPMASNRPRPPPPKMFT